MPGSPPRHKKGQQSIGDDQKNHGNWKNDVIKIVCNSVLSSHFVNQKLKNSSVT